MCTNIHTPFSFHQVSMQGYLSQSSTVQTVQCSAINIHQESMNINCHLFLGGSSYFSEHPFPECQRQSQQSEKKVHLHQKSMDLNHYQYLPIWLWHYICFFSHAHYRMNRKSVAFSTINHPEPHFLNACALHFFMQT